MNFAPIRELGLTELVGINEQIDQNDFTKSVALPVGGSGYITNIVAYGAESGDGAIPAVDSFMILVFDVDPDISAGNTTLSADTWRTCLGSWYFEGATSDTTGSASFNSAGSIMPIPYHDCNTLYFVGQWLNATAINDDPANNEQVHINVWVQPLT
jgi:hypothetical protein